MKKMRFGLLLMSILLVLSLTFAACDKGGATVETTHEDTTVADTTEAETTEAETTEAETTEAETTEAETTEAETTATTKTTYTVKVVNEKGEALADATVQFCVGDICQLPQLTDSTGEVVLELDEADYAVKVTLTGYSGEASYAFPAGSTTLTVTLTSDEPETTEPETTEPETTEPETTEEETTEIVDVPVGEVLDAPHATQFTVSTVFASDMVVQRGEFIRVWGWADADQNGKKVTGEFKGMFAEAIIVDGAWEITFTARLEASAELGHTMTIYGDGVSYSFNDVLVGDVYMVIGQSNIAYGVGYHLQYVSTPSLDELDYDAPIRLHCNNINPSIDYTGKGSGKNSNSVRSGATWKRADAYNKIHDFSALGYFFAMNYAKLTDNTVPLGLIEIAASGEPLGAFMSNEAAEKLNDERAGLADTYDSATGRYMTSGVNGVSPARYIYNDYMYAFEHYAMAGIIWYQGESDLKQTDARNYLTKFTALIEHMRSTHNLINKDFPVYFVEFPTIFEKPADHVGEWHWLDVGFIRAFMGEIQRALPNSYQIVSTDLWNDKTLANNLHPNCKYEQGMRTAQLVAAVNGEAGVTMAEANGPILVSMEVLEDGKTAILTYENVGTGLTTTDGGTDVKGFVLLRKPASVITSKPITATITAYNQITITCESNISGIIYNGITTNEYGVDVNLCNSEGVPAGATYMFK